MWFTSEPSFRMSSFKTRIRRRKYALTREGTDPPPQNTVGGDTSGGCTKEATAEWQFVNFNPAIFGRGRASQPTLDLGVTPPPLPPREPPPMMPPPRPPPVSPPVSLQDDAGMLRARASEAEENCGLRWMGHVERMRGHRNSGIT